AKKPGRLTAARPAVYQPPVGAQVASLQSPILRWSTHRVISSLQSTRRSAHYSCFARTVSPFANYKCLLLLTRLSPFARTATAKSEVFGIWYLKHSNFGQEIWGFSVLGECSGW